MFLNLLTENPQFYFAVIITVVISITVHELAHGWAAISRGDSTPIDSGHMTLNPLVHMGPMSLVALALVGIAWGSMPINPSRQRGRYSEAYVAAAGPATNLLLALLSLTALGLWMRFGGGSLGGGAIGGEAIGGAAAEASPVAGNLRQLLFVFGMFNIVLCLFNLLPIPPLDGSHILANFVPGYRNLLHDPSKQGIFLGAFLLLFFFGGRYLFSAASTATHAYLGLFAG